MRISWLSAEEIAAARQALKVFAAFLWDCIRLGPEFAIRRHHPIFAARTGSIITEHVARRARVRGRARQAPRRRARFAGSGARSKGHTRRRGGARTTRAISIKSSARRAARR
jgi:hypothetical protein